MNKTWSAKPNGPDHSKYNCSKWSLMNFKNNIIKVINEIFTTFESTPETFWASVKSLSPETRLSSSLIETLRISAPFWKCIGINNNKYWNIFIRIYCKTTNQTPTQDLCSETDTSQKHFSLWNVCVLLQKIFLSLFVLWYLNYFTLNPLKDSHISTLTTAEVWKVLDNKFTYEKSKSLFVLRSF